MKEPAKVDEYCCSESDKYFYFRQYKCYISEYEPEEKSELEGVMGAEPTSSFVLECRHACGRFALNKLIELVESESAVIDDDLGGLWNLAQLKAACVASEKATIYNIGEHQN